MGFKLVGLFLRIRLVLAQFLELRYMHQHINRDGWNGSNFPRMACIIFCWLYHLGFRLDQESNKF